MVNKYDRVERKVTIILNTHIFVENSEQITFMNKNKHYWFISLFG